MKLEGVKVLDLSRFLPGPHLTGLSGRQTHLGIPIESSNEPGGARPTAPRLGEHTVNVLRSAGLSEAELEAALKVV